jgi:UDP-3-O-[3-hydroxymyristoyl] glucosamine N-acyltransferase
LNLTDIAKIIGISYEGAEINITGINTLSQANESEISFVSGEKYLHELPLTKAAAVIIEAKHFSQVPKTTIAFISDEPYLKMAILSKYFAYPIIDKDAPKPIIGKNSHISSKAEIENGAIIGDNCTILAGAYVGLHVSIADNVTIYPNVTVYPYCKIDTNSIIHAGTVIGSDGFGFAHTKMGEHVKIYQNGNVIIEKDVEIGANCTIDSAAFGSTIIKQGAKIDNLVQIGHNCIIGEHSILVSQVGVSGSTTLGRNVVMGGQSATAGHLEIAPFTTLAARSGVTKDIKENGKTFAGFPLMEHRLWLKLQARIAKLLR